MRKLHPRYNILLLHVAYLRYPTSTPLKSSCYGYFLWHELGTCVRVIWVKLGQKQRASLAQLRHFWHKLGLVGAVKGVCPDDRNSNENRSDMDEQWEWLDTQVQTLWWQDRFALNKQWRRILRVSSMVIEFCSKSSTSSYSSDTPHS